MTHSDGGDKQNRFDWDSFQQQFFQGGRWKESLTNHPEGRIPWIESFVNDLLAKVMPKDGLPNHMVQSIKRSNPVMNTMDIGNQYLVRIRITNGADPKQVKITGNERELKITGLPEMGIETIQLKEAVNPEKSIAFYKNGFFEIQLPKKKYDQYREIEVLYL